MPKSHYGRLVLDTIEAETEQVAKHESSSARGRKLEHIVKTTIFIIDMSDFAKINTVYGSYFNEKTAPARETVQVSCLPKM
jgi:2-iminobutanoate/2-iminopropanoate deaminase